MSRSGVTSATNVGDLPTTTPASIKVMRRFIYSSWAHPREQELILNFVMTPTAGTDLSKARDSARPAGSS
jgi:hypothetical protein